MPEENRKKPNTTIRVIRSAPERESKAVAKAEVQTHKAVEDALSTEFIDHPYALDGLDAIVNDSTILPQCIRAYGQNIAGFGIGLRYRDDKAEETDEMREEWIKAEQIIGLLSADESAKDLFKNLVSTREVYGISYLECIRDISGMVVECALISDSSTVMKGRMQESFQDYLFWNNGEQIVRKKRFRKYKQEVGGRTVYFREFGDPRMMDNRSGEYISEGDGPIESKYQANELLEIKIGTSIYGTVRWFGQLLGLDGSKKAESLNNNYFKNGRHTPLLISISGGSITDKSYEKLQEYMNGIKGEAGQHAFLLLEVENSQSGTAFEEGAKPVVEVKDIAGILQKDGLFHEYQEDSRKNVQSSFLLPDIYVARSTDYNRSTAQTAMEITEKQVFQPERDSLAWIINNKLLNCYGFKYVEAYFEAPDISNPDDLYKILSFAANAGGITPNKAKAVAYAALGEVSEDYTDEWGNIPVRVQELMRSQGQEQTPGAMSLILTEQQLEAAIQKAAAEPESDEVVSVMKEVRRLLEDMKSEGD